MPAGAVDGETALAMSMHASPGVYAVLLGSGASIASGVKTGWGIVQDLVSRVAATHEADSSGAAVLAAEDPETWWSDTFGEQLGYSSLLAQVAKTPADRQAQLARYFKPDEGDDAPDGDKRPTAAHRALAQLVKRGIVRVIVTTNFDRLMESALDEVAISAQVVHQPDQYDAIQPLAHSAVTIIKLHGDYADLAQRNTVDELETYPDAQLRLLERVLDEYGLLVCGWSAEWDKALVRALEGTRSRRYPLFWSQYGALGADSKRLTAQHSATVIEGRDADELFTRLLRNIDAFDQLAAPPITRDLAVVRLKRVLLDPVRVIELRDLIDQTVTAVVANSGFDRRPIMGGTAGADFARVFEENLSGYRADTDTLLHLLANGVFHDDAGTHNGLWTRALERLNRIRGTVHGSSQEGLEKLRHLPSLLATYAIGLAAVLSHREDLLASLLTTPTWSGTFSGNTPQLPALYLNPGLVLAGDALNAVYHPTGGSRYRYPQSQWLQEELREPLRLVEPDDTAFLAAFDRFELLASMIALDVLPKPMNYVWEGVFLLDGRWGSMNGLAQQVQAELTADWPLLQAGAFGGDLDRAQAAYTALQTHKIEHPRF
ncbi:SIR2-like protein [Streptomyces sp. 846.5]|nr:SIR2-like protein [Streptomyces sp. 846.5]